MVRIPQELSGKSAHQSCGQGSTGGGTTTKTGRTNSRRRYGGGRKAGKPPWVWSFNLSLCLFSVGEILELFVGEIHFGQFFQFNSIFFNEFFNSEKRSEHEKNSIFFGLKNFLGWEWGSPRNHDPVDTLRLGFGGVDRTTWRRPNQKYSAPKKFSPDLNDDKGVKLGGGRCGRRIVSN